MKVVYRRYVSLMLSMTLLSGSVHGFASENSQIILNGDVTSHVNIPSVSSAELNEITNCDYFNITQLPPADIPDFDTYEARTSDAVIAVPETGVIEVPSQRYELNETLIVEEEKIQRIEAMIASDSNDETWQMQTNSVRSVSSSPVDASYRLGNINSRDSFALQNQTAKTSYMGDNIGEEYIDPLTGNLIVKETDLILPGVDGLDLNLSRYYSLAQAELYTKTADISTESKTYEVPAGWYIVTEEVYNTETQQASTCQYAYSTEEAAYVRIDEILSRDTCNGMYIYAYSIDVSNQGDTITYSNYITSEITSTSYQTMRSNLGAGWSWSFPSVQPIKSNFNDFDEFEYPEALYYHDGKGGVMEVDCTDPSDCFFTNYAGGDISIEIWGLYDTDISSTARIDYMVEDSDCTKYYFGPRGEIRTIMDIHGNKIEFSYEYMDFYGADDMPVISSITDTVGRVVNFEYISDSGYDYIEIEVTSPFEIEESIKLEYKKRMQNVTNNDVYFSTEPILESVTNPDGETTMYYPAVIQDVRSDAQPVEFTFADKTFESDYVVNTSGYSNNLVHLLGDIVRPHSTTTYYYELDRRNLGHSGVSEAYKVSARKDSLLVVKDDIVIQNYERNFVSYGYNNDYTGYPYYNSVESIPEEMDVCTSWENQGNSTVIHGFYKIDDAILEKNTNSTYANPVGEDLHVLREVTIYNSKMPAEVKLTYSNDSDYSYDSYLYYDISLHENKYYGKPLFEPEEMDYDTMAGENRYKHGISYTYDSNTGFVLSKSWYKTNSTKCTERYTYDSKGRLTSYIKADGTSVIYSYEYTDGKVSKITTITENDTGKTTVVENYTAATAYAFPSSVVKTVTANNVTTTQTTSYTYDMLWGVVKTMTDNDGNTTYYDYDSMGRLTRTTYPVYSAYSAFGTKDIRIMPVEYTLYSTSDGYTCEGLLNSGEKARVEEIYNTMIYYDVSDSDISNPPALDTSTLARTFQTKSIGYYTGTGELIENKVLDVVDGSYGIRSTQYYYNTYNNTVKTVDSDGSLTVVQYDGAGRKVKFTDKFDNYRIMEYNIGGEGAGFKAESYFVPASDRTAKQNVKEYTYDRLGRTTKEKSYSSYSDASVEVKYTYDLVGNVIGIIDANNNLNEDGYTQTNTYDKLNRVTSTKNANNEVIRNIYDNAGNIKKQTITDGSGNESILYQRSYDGEGKIVTDTDNTGNSNLYTYDSMGRLRLSQDKDDKLDSFEYNELGTTDMTSSEIDEESIIARNYSYLNPYGANTVFDVRGTYDADTGLYPAYLNETLKYSYSPTGNLMEQYSSYAISTGVSGVKFKPYIEYTYDELGNISSVFYGNIYGDENRAVGATTNYEYDKNRVSKVQIDGESTKNTSDAVNVRYEYYDDGKLKSVTCPALTDNTVLKSEYVYDGLSRLLSLTNYKGTEVLSSYTYTYDNNGNILTVNETVGATQNTTAYTYDKLNRISTVSGSKGADSYYEYDARGNRKANFEQIDFLTEENAQFNYDAEDNLYYSQVGSDGTYMDYSADGYRYIKQENSDYPEFYTYDSNGRLLALSKPVNLSLSDSVITTMYPTTQYIWGPDRVLAQFDVLNNKLYYYLYNGHGDVVQITDTVGNVVNTYDYEHAIIGTREENPVISGVSELVPFSF